MGVLGKTNIPPRIGGIVVGNEVEYKVNEANGIQRGDFVQFDDSVSVTADSGNVVCIEKLFDGKFLVVTTTLYTNYPKTQNVQCSLKEIFVGSVSSYGTGVNFTIDMYGYSNGMGADCFSLLKLNDVKFVLLSAGGYIHILNYDYENKRIVYEDVSDYFSDYSQIKWFGSCKINENVFAATSGGKIRVFDLENKKSFVYVIEDEVQSGYNIYSGVAYVEGDLYAILIRQTENRSVFCKFSFDLESENITLQRIYGYFYDSAGRKSFRYVTKYNGNLFFSVAARLVELIDGEVVDRGSFPVNSFEIDDLKYLSARDYSSSSGNNYKIQVDVFSDGVMNTKVSDIIYNANNNYATFIVSVENSFYFVSFKSGKFVNVEGMDVLNATPIALVKKYKSEIHGVAKTAGTYGSLITVYVPKISS